jgi:3-phenylpropionate/trans-cinnamate dioxygenase ferredoxin subunit
LKYLRVGKVGDLDPGETKTVSPERGEHIVLCNVGGNYYAIRDTCTHDGGMLGYGALEGSLIECPRHGAKFDVTTGKAMAPPAVTPVTVYPVRVRDGHVEVELRG